MLSSHRYAMAGDAEEMYRCLDEAVAQGRTFGLWLKVHPNWNPYRSDPRFQDLLRRIGFPED
jgi:hypothetical protein